MSIPLLADRLTLATALALTAVLFLPAAADPVNVVKLAAAMCCALLVVLLAAARVIRERVVRLPRALPALTGVALGLALTSSALAAPSLPTALLGTYGRNSGLLAYGSALVLYFVALRVLDQQSTAIIAVALVAAGLFTATYGLLQYLGIDAINWANEFNPIIASLGNPDFASGYLGIAAPVALWGGLNVAWPRLLRAGFAFCGALFILVALLSSSVQGPIAAAAGLAVIAVAWLLDRDGAVRRWGLTAIGVLAGAVALVVVAGLAHLGPAAGIFSDSSFRARTWYWRTALTMFRQHPILGVGLDQYGSYWRQLRPAEATRRLGGENFSDAAHSVPLQMLSQGGVVLAVAYVCFVIVVAVVLVRGLGRLSGQPRLRLAGLGGSWVAYQMQSVVSIDQVPLLIAAFVLAGAVVVAAGPVAFHEVRLPGAAPLAAEPRPGRNRGRKSLREPRQRVMTTADRAGLAVVLGVGLVLLWLAFIPLRADMAVRRGDVDLANGVGTPAIAAYTRATELLPVSSLYWAKLGNLLDTAQRDDQALRAFEQSLRHDPRNVASLRSAAGLAAAANRGNDALRWYRAAADLDPTNPVVVIETADFEVAHGAPEDAARRLERALKALPDDAQLWAALGDVQVATGANSRARTSYERSLALQPRQPRATAGLAKLTKATP